MATTAMKRPAFGGFTHPKALADFPAAGGEPQSPHAELQALREIQAEQAQQRETLATILRLLERGRGARDQADVALLLAVAESISTRPFTSGQLVAHADADPALREALTAADVTSAQQLGCLCRRIQGVALAGFRLVRVGDQRAGIQWQVQVCED